MITLPEIPNTITGFSFNVKKITSSKTTMNFLKETNFEILDGDTKDVVVQLEIKDHDLIFVNDKTFSDAFNENVKKREGRLRNEKFIKKAYLLRLLYKGEKVSVSTAINDKGHIVVNDPEYCVVSTDTEKKRKTKKNLKSIKTAGVRKVVLGKRASSKLEAIRLSAMRHGMKQALSYKELIDKYNVRRFSTNLRINNRPATIEEINRILYEKRELSYTDLSQTTNRINFSVLFAMTYGNITLEDIYGKNVIFEDKNEQKDKRISDLSNALIGIIKKGNGIEIAHTYINMINAFTSMDPPPVDMNDLAAVMDNYSIYYACAYLAILCDNFFKINDDLKLYMKKHYIHNYWNYVEKVILMKRYSTVVSFCNKMAAFDIEAYINDSHYQDEILFSFERAFKFSSEIKDITEKERKIPFNE